MNTRIILIFLVTIISAFAETQKRESLTTLKGKTYTGLTITKHTPSSLHFIHSAGAAVVPFEDLSKELQEQYNYDPIEAAEYKKKEAVLDAQRRKQRAIERTKYNKLVAEKKEKEKQKKAHKELLKTAQKNSFYVKQVLKNGLLVNNVRVTVISSGSASIGGGGGVYERKSVGSSVYYVEGYPDIDKVADGKYIKGVFYEKGVYSYVDIRGAKRTVKKFIYLPAPKK